MDFVHSIEPIIKNIRHLLHINTAAAGNIYEITDNNQCNLIWHLLVANRLEQYNSQNLDTSKLIEYLKNEAHHPVKFDIHGALVDVPEPILKLERQLADIKNLENSRQQKSQTTIQITIMLAMTTGLLMFLGAKHNPSAPMRMKKRKT